MVNGASYSYQYDKNGNVIKKTYNNDIALGKPATAIAYSGSNQPSRANDTDRTNNSFWGVDLNGTSKWWKVDLGDIYELNRVVLRNYVDGTRYYTYNIEASVDGVNWIEVAKKTNSSVATDQGDSYTLQNINARYMRVNMNSNSANSGVHITDFRAYGEKASIALYKPATAVSYSGLNQPSRANDTDRTNDSFWGVDLNGTSKWWKVDLGDIYKLNRVVLRNYVDGTRYYTYNIEASVDGVNWIEVAKKTNSSVATDQGDSYTLQNISARYMRVNMNSNSANSGVHITDFRAYGVKL